MHRELPQFLHWSPGQNRSPLPQDDNILFSLHLDFLLYRILGRRTQVQSDELAKASREILSPLLQMVAKKNRARNPPVDFGWIVSISRAGGPSICSYFTN